MSDYLTRLIPRKRESGATPHLMPMVRSVSPIARHDQRIGAVDTDSYALVGASSGPSEPKHGSARPDETEAGSRAETAPEVAGSDAVTQRKTLASAGAAPPPIPGDAQAGTGDGVELSHPGPRAGKIGAEPVATEREPGGSDVWAGAIVDEPHAAVRSARVDSQISVVGGPDVSTRLSIPPAMPMEPAWEEENTGSDPLVVPSESTVPDSPVSAIPGVPLGEHGEAARRPDGPMVYTRRVPREDDSDPIPLEPKPRAFVEPLEPPPGSAAESSRPAEESPRVVIGRINVEVVQPAEQPAGSVPRPQPLTAESASVIGPLRGGGRSDSSFSPRNGQPWR